jgi:mycothiol synthase
MTQPGSPAGRRTAPPDRPATRADAGLLAELFRAAERHTPVGLPAGPGEVHARLATPALDLSRDTLLTFDAAGVPVGYADVTDTGAAGGRLRLRVTAVTRPGAPTGTAEHLHAWLLARAAALRDERHPGVPALLGTRCGGADTDRQALLARTGFTVVREYLDLAHDLTTPQTPAPPVGVPPAGTVPVALMPFDPGRSEETRVVHNDAYAADPGALLPDPDGWPAHAIGLPGFQPETSCLALAGDRVVAFLLALRQPGGDGTPGLLLHCLGTLPAWRGRGLAAAMISRALRRERAAGTRSAHLQVAAGNTAAVRLYHRLGFTDSGRGHLILNRPL